MDNLKKNHFKLIFFESVPSLSQMGQRTSRRERERREEEAMIREIERTLNDGMLLADKLTKEVFPNLKHSYNFKTNSK